MFFVLFFFLIFIYLFLKNINHSPYPLSIYLDTHKDLEMAFALAEKYKHFQLLIELCDTLNADDRLETYVQQFESDGFAQDLFQWYIDNSKFEFFFFL